MKKLGNLYSHSFLPVKVSVLRILFRRGQRSLAEREGYIEELLADISAYGREYGGDYSVDTVFIGGGTPSILKLDRLNVCFQRCAVFFQWKRMQR